MEAFCLYTICRWIAGRLNKDIPVCILLSDSQIQRCIIHMLRNSFKYVNYRDFKKFSSDFKSVYHAPNEPAALSELENIKERWGKKYPYGLKGFLLTVSTTKNSLHSPHIFRRVYTKRTSSCTGTAKKSSLTPSPTVITALREPICNRNAKDNCQPDQCKGKTLRHFP